MKIGINNNSNPAFTSKIKYVAQWEFKNLPLKELRIGGKYIDFPYQTDQIITNTEAYTDNIRCCTAGGITNLDKVMMFHLSPPNNLRNFNQVEKKIRDCAKTLREDNDTLNGFLTGGFLSKKTPMSPILFFRLKELFKELHIKFSVLWGQPETNQSQILYSAKDDTWLVNSHPFCASRLEPYSFMKSFHELQSSYNFLSVSPLDKLYIDEKKINVPVKQ